MWTSIISVPDKCLFIYFMIFIPLYYRCNATSVSAFPQCLSNGTEYITAEDILANAGIDIPIYCYISTLVIIFIVLRIIAYFILRFRRILIS